MCDGREFHPRLPGVAMGRLALVKVTRGGNRPPRFFVMNRANDTLPRNGEILCTDDDYPILKMSREWAIEQTRKGRDVTPQDFL